MFGLGMGLLAVAGVLRANRKAKEEARDLETRQRLALGLAWVDRCEKELRARTYWHATRLDVPANKVLVRRAWNGTVELDFDDTPETAAVLERIAKENAEKLFRPSPACGAGAARKTQNGGYSCRGCVCWPCISSARRY